MSLGVQIRTGNTKASYDDGAFGGLGSDKQDLNDVRGIVRIGISHWR